MAAAHLLPMPRYNLFAGDKRIVVTDAGAGFSTPPKVTIKGLDSSELVVTLHFAKDLKKNGLADGIRFVLLTPGVPHAVELGLVVIDDVRTHHGHLLPRLFC